MRIKKLQGEEEKRHGYYYEFDMEAQPIGEGGMGKVYKGFRVNEVTGVRTPVAIKAMFDDLPPEVYERARREASIQLHNDNLIEMLGFVADSDVNALGEHKIHYHVISEFLNGVVLSDLLYGKLTDKDGIEIPFARQLYTQYTSDREKAAVHITKCILSGIMALHDKGYIHRDIDPSNIMVTKEGNIKLIDFGIAKLLNTLGSHDKSVTTTGIFIGKAEYASPELVLGDVPHQGYTTDIYAIGILFYQLLTGRLPFTGSKFEVLQHQLKTNTPLHMVEPRRYRKIIRKATAKRQSDRYVSAAEFRVALDKDDGSCGWTEIWAGNLPKLAAAAGVTILIGATAYFLWGTTPLSGSEPDQVNPASQSTLQANVPASAEDISHEETVDSKPETAAIRPSLQAALARLDASAADSARLGFNQMKWLADSARSARAMYELGLTYCNYEDKLDPAIVERRKILGFTKHNTSPAESISWLEKAYEQDSASLQTIYWLGYSYWRSKAYAKAEKILSRAAGAGNPAVEEDARLQADSRKYLRLSRKELN